MPTDCGPSQALSELLAVSATLVVHSGMPERKVRTNTFHRGPYPLARKISCLIRSCGTALPNLSSTHDSHVKRGIKLRIKSALLAAIMAVAGLAGLAGTANACTSADGGHSCLHSAANFTGSRFDDAAASTANWGAHSYIGTSVRLYAGDGSLSNVSSMRNFDPNSTVAVYYNSNYRGPCFTITANGRASNFANVRLSDGTTANDRMNSHHYNQRCGPLVNS